MTHIHATCVVLGTVGVLIRGPSGAGKSDLALRLIDGGAELVSDDYCDVEALDGKLVATPPTAIAGKIEMRGFGIVEMPHRPVAAVGLVVDLLPESEIERMPEAPTCTIDGISVPKLMLNGFAASAAGKIRLLAARFA
jgi:HPr kinase/phosphorylase